VRRATILVAAAVALASSVAQAAPGPTLQVVRERPAVVRGERFKGGERVTVQLYASRRWTRTATATGAGVVTVTFPVTLPACGRYTLQAFGSKGSRARSLPAHRVCSDPSQ